MAGRKATAAIQAKTVTIASRNEALPHGKKQEDNEERTGHQ
ncbi:MAG: hypothetical protein ACJ72M_17775 [Propionibacteriaceae bacterium]